MKGSHPHSLRNRFGETVDQTQPLPVVTAEGLQITSKSQTLTYNGKAAAGAITICQTDFKPIMGLNSGRVASFWGEERNKVYEAYADGNPKAGPHNLRSVVETNGSAAFVVYDLNLHLENLFESATTTVKRFVAKVTDKNGKSLYGWIFGVSVSSDVYTFQVVNHRLTETQNWVGTLADFTHTALEKVEIFAYDSSLAFGTETTLTEEVACPREFSKNRKAQIEYAEENLTDGQFIVDYERGDIIGKKADTTASETITYNVLASVVGLGSDVTVSLGDGTNFPAAINTANADGVSNTHKSLSVTSRPLGFNGTTWDRLRAGITAVTATLTGWLNTLPWAVYNASPTTRTDGQGGPLQANANGDLKVGVRSEDSTTNVMKVQVQATYANGTASAAIKSAAGQFMGFCVNSASAGATIKFWDNTAGSGTVLLNTITYTSAVNEGPKVTALPAVKFNTGLYMTITGTMDITVFYN